MITPMEPRSFSVKVKPEPVLFQLKFVGNTTSDPAETFCANVEEEPNSCDTCGASNHESPWRVTVKVSNKPIIDQRFPALDAAIAFLRSEYQLP